MRGVPPPMMGKISRHNPQCRGLRGDLVASTGRGLRPEHCREVRALRAKQAAGDRYADCVDDFGGIARKWDKERRA